MKGVIKLEQERRDVFAGEGCTDTVSTRNTNQKKGKENRRRGKKHRRINRSHMIWKPFSCHFERCPAMSFQQVAPNSTKGQDSTKGQCICSG